MSRRHAVLRAAAVVATLAAAFWLFWATFESAAQIRWSQLDPALLACAFAVSLLQEFAGTASAKAALAAFKQRASFIRLLVITTVATAANSVIPAPAGVPARVWLQKNWLGIAVSTSTAAIALEFLCGYGTLAVFALGGAYLFGTNLVALGAKYAPAVTAIIVLMLLSGSLVAWLLRDRLRILMKRFASLRPSPRPALSTATLNIAIIALATLRLWLILRALGITSAPILEITGALCISRVAGIASMIPMGFGSRDVTLMGLLALATVPLPIAILAAATDRVLSTVPYLTVALVGWPLLRRSRVINHASDAH